MNPVFEKQYEVGFNEVDTDGMTRPANFFNWFQNTASSQSHAIGFPLTDLIAKDLTWVVSKYRIAITRRPKWREPVIVRTWRRPQESDFSAPRDFEVIAVDGSPIARATGSFRLIGISSKKILSPQEVIPNYPVLDRKMFDNDSILIKMPEKTDIIKKFDVRRSDLDMNRHVNNINYVIWATETVPDEIWKKFTVSEAEIVFKKSAGYLDIIQVSSSETNSLPDPGYTHAVQCNDTDLALVKTVWVKK